jgi:hypothetical protein
MLVKQQQQSVYYSIQENHIKEVHDGAANGLDGTRARKRYYNYLLLQLVNGIFQLLKVNLPETLLITLILSIPRTR